MFVPGKKVNNIKCRIFLNRYDIKCIKMARTSIDMVIIALTQNRYTPLFCIKRINKDDFYLKDIIEFMHNC